MYPALLTCRAAAICHRCRAARNFAGFYAGGSLGWGYYDHAFSDRDGLGQSIDNGLPNSVNATGNRVNFGPQAGYTFQNGCAVYGFDADWSWTSLKVSERSLDGGQGAAGVTDSVTVTSKLRWFGTLRMRTGIVVDNLLLYATGGIAYANFDRTWAFFEDASAVTTSFTAQKTLFGWTGGVGTEWAWNDNWSLRSEVLYMRFASDNNMVAGAAPIGVTGVALSPGQPGLRSGSPASASITDGADASAAMPAFFGRGLMFKTEIQFLDLWYDFRMR